MLVTVPWNDRTEEGLRRHLQRARDHVTWRMAGPDDKGAAARLLLLRLEEGQLEQAAALAMATAAAPIADPELRGAIDARLVDLDVSTRLRVVGQKDRHTLGPAFLRILRQGPKPSVHVSRGLYYAVLEWAEKEGDVAAFGEGLTAMEQALQATDPDAPWVAPLLDRYRATLVRLRERAGR